MPAAIMSTVQEWQDEFFELVERVREPVVRFAADVAESVVDYVPEPPAWPFLSKLPTVSEVVENQIAFASRFVEEQAEFSRSMVKAVQPVLARREVKPAPSRKTRKAGAAAPKAA